MRPVARQAVLAFLLAASASAQWASQQDARIAPSPNDLLMNDEFGGALDIEGSTLVVGAHWHDPVGGAANDGAAWVWTRSANGWMQEAKLLSTTHSGDHLGYSVSLSGDTVALGAPFETVGAASSAGAVYVFTRSIGGVWSLEARLTAADFGAVDRFGGAVDLDGDTLAIGAANDDVSSVIDQGSAYVFTRAGGVWTQQAKLVASDGASSDLLGSSLSLSGDRILVGSPQHDGPSLANRGAAYLFERAGANWIEVAKLEPADGGASDRFGSAVALDADTAVVGSPSHDGTVPDAGAAYVYLEAAGAWTLQQKLTDSGVVFVDQFGAALALEGDRLAVGLPGNNVPSTGAGAVQFFTRTGSVWTGHFDMIGSDTDFIDRLGRSVAISGDWVAGGAPDAETVAGGPNVGEAYVFKIAPPPLIESYCTAKTNSLGCVPTMSWTGTPSVSNPSPFELLCTQVINFKQGLLFYGYAPSAAPFQGGVLCVATPLRRTPIQNSLGSSPPINDCSGQYSLDMNAVAQSGADANLIVGANVWCQYWMRDPQSPSTTGLSDSVHFELDP